MWMIIGLNYNILSLSDEKFFRSSKKALRRREKSAKLKGTVD